MSATVSTALAAGIARLRAAGVEDPARDARRLMAHVLGIDPGRLSLAGPEPLPGAAEPLWQAALEARLARQPVAQIIGKRAFYGRDFAVTRDTLDPRPETELLVDLALLAPFTRVLDIGTGTGCILLTLLAERPAAGGIGTDLSAAALAVAEANARAHQLENRAELCRTAWAGGISGRFDLIVSNPPYISEEELPMLAPEVRLWEPHMALSPGADGYAAYRAILQQIGDLAGPGTRLLFEIGATQAAGVGDLCRQAGWDQVTVHRDLNGHDRVVSAIRSPNAGQ